MTPKKYRYKHTIEAVQWDGTMECRAMIMKMFHIKQLPCCVNDAGDPYLFFDDDMYVYKDDWFLKAINIDDVWVERDEDYKCDYGPVDDSIVGKVARVTNNSSYPITVLICHDGIVIEDLKGANSTGLESGWLPIESAPLGYNAEKGFTHILFKGRSVSRSFSGYVYVSGWMSHDRKPQHNYSYKLEILGWKHLPE